jgi:hypothetical protein
VQYFLYYVRCSKYRCLYRRSIEFFLIKSPLIIILVAPVITGVVIIIIITITVKSIYEDVPHNTVYYESAVPEMDVVL